MLCLVCTQILLTPFSISCKKQKAAGTRCLGKKRQPKSHCIVARLGMSTCRHLCLKTLIIFISNCVNRIDDSHVRGSYNEIELGIKNEFWINWYSTLCATRRAPQQAMSLVGGYRVAWLFLSSLQVQHISILYTHTLCCRATSEYWVATRGLNIYKLCSMQFLQWCACGFAVLVGVIRGLCETGCFDFTTCREFPL